MKAFELDNSSLEGLLDSMVGNLYRKAVRNAYRASQDGVFTITQCSSFVQEMEEKL
jgi:hypothetical protein